MRLVCVGDSFTEGMCDDLRADGHFRGWSDRVADALATDAGAIGGGVEYANLAVRGKLLDQVVDEQLAVATSMRPTVLTFHAGPNDVLRRGTDLADLFRRYDAAVTRAADSSDTLVLFTAIGRAGGTGRLAALLADRFAQFNVHVREAAARNGAVLVDLEPVPALTDRRLWFSDRLHLNAAGHARVAAAVLDALDVPDPARGARAADWWRQPLPPPPTTSRRSDLAADAVWVQRHLLPWVGRRLRGVSSGDGRSAKDPVLRPVAPAD